MGCKGTKLDKRVWMPYDVSMAYADPHDERAKAARRKHYHKNKEAYLARARALETQLKNYVAEQKNYPCMDCGIEYSQWVMEFDHRPDETKLFNISALVKRGNFKALVEEIAKCDVVCANCHRMRTALRGNWEAMLLE